jgi:hypothetical protein
MDCGRRRPVGAMAIFRQSFRRMSHRLIPLSRSVSIPMRRLRGITVIAVICFLYAGYLGAAAVSLLVWPGSQPLLPALQGLASARHFVPYIAIIGGLGWTLIGRGLVHSRNRARWAMMLVAAWGAISSLALLYYSDLWGPFLWIGLQIMVRVVVVCYLLRSSVARQFSSSRITV